MSTRSFVGLLGVLFLPLIAHSYPINLNDFTPDPDWAVDIAPDGSSATLYEDFSYSSILLYGVIDTTLQDLTIEFTYDFQLGEGNYDDFNAYLYDPDTLMRIDPFPGYEEVLVESSQSGTVVWDISSAQFLGSPIGLEFDLNSWDWDLDSTVTISDVSKTAVPEASTLFLFGSGLLGTIPMLRKRRRRDSSR